MSLMGDQQEYDHAYPRSCFLSEADIKRLVALIRLGQHEISFNGI